jgi:hypothetical protein
VLDSQRRLVIGDLGSGDCPTEAPCIIELTNRNGATRSPQPENAVALASFASPVVPQGDWREMAGASGRAADVECSRLLNEAARMPGHRNAVASANTML